MIFADALLLPTAPPFLASGESEEIDASDRPAESSII
jgi:hypothetical protein